MEPLGVAGVKDDRWYVEMEDKELGLELELWLGFSEGLGFGSKSEDGKAGWLGQARGVPHGPWKNLLRCA